MRESLALILNLQGMWKALRPLNALVARIRGGERQNAQRAQHRLLERPSREDVLHAFRMILGREPEDQRAIEAHMLIPTVADLRRVLLSSDEFQGKYKVMHPDVYDHPSLSMDRDTLVLIHLHKTGGTSLRAMLAGQFPADRICPVREDKLHLLSAAQLGRYDFFAGHFDQLSIRLIPRIKIKTIALFRDPRARLISLYRFLRSHPARDEFAADQLIRIANESTAEEFFERPETRSLSPIHNYYLSVFGKSHFELARNPPSLSKEEFSHALGQAKLQIRALTSLGITERFEQSVELICKVVNLSRPPSIAMLHVTDNFTELDARFRRVDPVTMTPRLAAALEDLTAYDGELYRFAVGEFERRRAEAGGSQT